ncbi:MAG: MBL fold metallo-hydrolase, partial [Spirochaetia bacterium]|nr:MBL fold metallo-hydrolase [Spirochaetia bacterium]
MIYRSYLHTEPAVAISYLLGCGSKSSAVVVDPVYPPDFYLKESKTLGMKILYVIDTHLHADHLSTARELSELSGAPYVLHESAQAKYEFHKGRDGESLRLGNTELTLWHTPGHTPEHLSILVTDHRRIGEPWMILTGHTLM